MELVLLERGEHVVGEGLEVLHCRAVRVPEVQVLRVLEHTGGVEDVVTLGAQDVRREIEDPVDDFFLESLRATKKKAVLELHRPWLANRADTGKRHSSSVLEFDSGHDEYRWISGHGTP